MMEFLWFLGIAFLIAIVIGIAKGKDRQNKKRQIEEKLQHITGFSPQKTVIKFGHGSTVPTGISIDADSHQICLIDGQAFTPMPFASVIEAEVLIDGDTVTKTSRGSQLAGVAVGAALLGGVGAVIGGLSGSTKATQKIKDVSLRLTLNSLQRPTHVVRFLEEDVSIEAIKKQALREADEWNSVLKVVLFQNKNSANEGNVAQIMSATSMPQSDTYSSPMG